MRVIIAFFALTVTMNAAAAVYKWVKPDGSVVYSDRAPEENTAPTELPALQEIKMPPPPPPPANSATGTSSFRPSLRTAYTTLAISSPANNSTFRDNAGQVTIKLNLEPALQGGDTIAITLDGREVGQGKSTAIALSNVDRGTHTLGAVVKNSQGETVISATPVTFTLQRTSVLRRHNP